MKKYIALLDLKDINLSEIIDEFKKESIKVEKVYSRLGLLLISTNMDIDTDIHKNIINLELVESKFSASEEE